MDRRTLSLAYSVADQNFVQTKSIGVLNLSLRLAEALAVRPEFQYLAVFSNSSLHPWHERLGSRAVYRFDGACATRVGRMLWDQARVYTEAQRRRVEWLMLPKGFASFCRRPPVRIAAYVHDVIEEHYRQRYPHAVSGAEAWYFRRSLLATLKYSSVIFTNSDFTRQELVSLSRRAGVPAPDIVVAGIGFRAVESASRAVRTGIIVLASPWPHKRTDLAIQFMAAWQEGTNNRAPVHWVGRFPAALRRPSYPSWHYHDRLEEDEYRALLATTRVVVYFSEYEGFGMPPVEALLNGACPVYSEIAATREVMRGVGAPFENGSLESFFAAMDTAVLMSNHELVNHIPDFLRRHDWSTVATRVVEALQRCRPPE